ncbi:MAG: hypothetical protein Q8S33_27225 [Myxococcales bacterium]|nr:hypothetical protein [Myxococcales bacterium]
MRLFLFTLLLCTASACGPVQRPCGPSTCTGCCDSSGQCQSGGSTSACGTRGAVCQVCGGSSATCVTGLCSSIGSSGGGASFGGGSAGGVGGNSAGGVGGGTSQPRGHLTLLWTFNGQGCASVPQVTNMRVTIPGLTLENNGVYPCTSAGTDGITLLNFVLGTYAVTVEGLDASGQVLFAATRQVVVNADVSLAIDLPAGSVRLSWSFPQAARCSQTGDAVSGRPVSRVRVTLDSQTPREFPCLDGSTADTPNAAVQLLMMPGAHTLQLRALDTSGFEFYAAATGFTATTSTTNLPVALQWTVGSLPLRWAFLNQGATISCAQAQVSSVFVNFRDTQTQRYIYVDANGAPTAGASVPCVSANAIQGTLFPFIPAANYEVFLQAPVAGNAYPYRTSQATTPVLQVSAGVFAQSEAMGQMLIMQ